MSLFTGKVSCLTSYGYTTSERELPRGSDRSPTGPRKSTEVVETQYGVGTTNVNEDEW